MLFLTGAAALFMVLVDLIRLKNKFLHNLYLSVFGKILREHELNNNKIFFTGGTYLVLSSFFLILLFPREIAILTILISVICDSSSSLIGRNFGKIKIFSKTIEGSIAFLVTGLVLIFITPKITVFKTEYYIAVIALIITSFIELIPSKIDDNIIIPFSFSLLYYLMFILII